MFRTWWALIFFLLTATAGADAPNEKTIAALYGRGLAGDAAAVDRCISALEQILKERPNDQLARVYLGSAYTLRSRDLSIFGTAKLAALRHGDALMDGAAAAAPENARVQLLRAVTYEAFPAILGRRQIAREALEKLVAATEKNPAELAPNDRQVLYLNAGEAAKKAGEPERARLLWERGLALAADPKLSEEIRAALAKL